ncbi:hypothetical protein [Nitrosomonas sp. Nm51]|uniref:hypothetical protein n=1 Tax=Nitrosomonas sp. Nm51 TaxID=133720 RepID=UPI00115FD4D3|nr:hypothetical protein [Nitrosomonas sp. Nm51]
MRINCVVQPSRAIRDRMVRRPACVYYGRQAADFSNSMRPSRCDELEITGANRIYLQQAVQLADNGNGR